MASNRSRISIRWNVHFSIDIFAHSMYNSGMIGQLWDDNRKPQWVRLVSCTALVFYLFTLVAVPMLHTHGGGHEAKNCCGEPPTPDSSRVPTPDSDDSCPVCEFAHLVVPFFTHSEPLIWRADTVEEIYSTLLIPSVASVTALPPCRAPPMI